MQVFIRKPSIDMFCGIKVEKDTVLEYEGKNVKQTLKDLLLHTVTKVEGEGYDSTWDTNIYLKEGDVLIFEEERGYIKPVEEFVTVAEAIDELTCIKDLG